MELNDKLLLKLIIQQLENVQESADEINARLNTVDTTLAINTAHLEEHMRRSDLNEEAVNILKAEIKPVRTVYDATALAVKLLGVLAVIATIIGVIFAGIELFLRK